jgi:hypothetical protein
MMSGRREGTYKREIPRQVSLRWGSQHIFLRKGFMSDKVWESLVHRATGMR